MRCYDSSSRPIRSGDTGIASLAEHSDEAAGE